MLRSFLAGLGALALAASGISVSNATECKLNAAQVYVEVSKSVARIFVLAIDPFDPYEKVRYSVGTGFVIDEDGTIITNYHVLLNAARINVGFNGGDSTSGVFIAGDPVLDIALIRPFMSGGDFKPLQLAEDDTLLPGSPVFAIGNPLGLKMSISTGVVSSTDVVVPVTTMSWDEPYIQTDAAINPGNSGGPLLDQCGKVVGMNTLGLTRAENIGFAIPSRTLRMAVSELLENGRIIRPWIGISGQMADEFVMSLANAPFTEGFMVETVEPGSAAEKAGLRGGGLPIELGAHRYLIGGDIIKSVNGMQVTDLSVTAKIVRMLKPGDRIKVEYFREGELLTLDTILPERPVLSEDYRVLYRAVYENSKDNKGNGMD
jgi:putative serine protease PepD